MLKSFNLLLYEMNDSLANNVDAEHIIALRCALVNFLEDVQKLNDEVQTTPFYVSKEDREHIRHIVKQAGELYLSLR